YPRHNILFVTFDDIVYGLGSNRFGQLGLGHNTPIPTPQPVPELCHQNIHQFFSGGGFVLAVNMDNNVIFSFGCNDEGQLGRHVKMSVNSFDVINKLGEGGYGQSFDVINKLGEGGYGQVYKVRYKCNHQFYAIKKCLLNGLTEKEKQNVLNETKSLVKFRSKFVIQYYYSWIEFVSIISQMFWKLRNHCLMN
ncbi:unnamed protein product, partial [Oppiella nova]